MTGEELITAIGSLVDDDPDESELIFLLNAAKNMLEGERDWMFLRAIDSSKTWATSDTYLTTKALPSDFVSPRKLYLSTNTRPMTAISLEDRERYKDIYGRYYIDYANNVFALCGVTSQSATIYLSYKKSSTDWTENNLTTLSPSFPSVYHPILAFYAAGIHLGGIDADDIAARMAPVHGNQFNAMRKNMRLWDAKLASHAMNNVASQPDVIAGTRPDVVGEGDIF